MKNIILSLAFLTIAFCTSSFAASLIDVPNKICPISNEKIGSNGMTAYTVTYKGKVYHLCCKMCIKEFNKDPKKYAKMMEAEVAQEQAKKN